MAWFDFPEALRKLSYLNEKKILKSPADGVGLVCSREGKAGSLHWEQAQIYLDWVNQEEIAHWLTRSLPVSPLEHQRWMKA